MLIQRMHAHGMGLQMRQQSFAALRIARCSVAQKSASATATSLPPFGKENPYVAGPFGSGRVSMDGDEDGEQLRPGPGRSRAEARLHGMARLHAS